MAKAESKDQPSGGPADHKRRAFAGKSIGSVAVVVLLGVYAIARPALNERFGWDLPDVRTDAHGQVTVDKPAQGSKSAAGAKPKDDSATEAKQAPATTKVGSESATTATSKASAEKGSPKTATTPKSGGPLAGRVQSPAHDNTSKSSATSPPAVSAGDQDLKYGLLKEAAKDRYVSPAGLQYTPGSAEGHRLEHLRRHTEDDRSRPGSHGVFDGGMEKALQTIDKAYERAKKGERTTKEVDGDRTIYTVDMGGRIGFVGGRDGQRKRNPMARRVRLVLEGTRVITAYPM